MADPHYRRLHLVVRYDRGRGERRRLHGAGCGIPPRQIPAAGHGGRRFQHGRLLPVQDLPLCNPPLHAGESVENRGGDGFQGGAYVRPDLGLSRAAACRPHVHLRLCDVRPAALGVLPDYRACGHDPLLRHHQAQLPEEQPPHAHRGVRGERQGRIARLAAAELAPLQRLRLHRSRLAPAFLQDQRPAHLLFPHGRERALRAGQIRHPGYPFPQLRYGAGRARAAYPARHPQRHQNPDRPADRRRDRR